MFWPLAEAGEEWVQPLLCQRFPCSQGRGSNTGQLARKGYLAVRESASCPLCQKLQGRSSKASVPRFVALWSRLARGRRSKVQGRVIRMFLK